MPPARLVLYAASLAGAVLAVRALVGRPPPLGLALLAVVAYVALVTTGVLVLRLRMFVDAVIEGPRGARGIALTFDDGPDPATTPRVLDALDRAGVSATFFVIGRKAEAHPDLVRDIVRRGHSVGLHSYGHDRLFSLRSAKKVREDLERGIAVLTAILGERPRIFRPPIGHTNPTIARVADELDLVVVGWNVSARDGTSRARAERVVARVRARARDGAIVLLHDASERGTHVPTAPETVPLLVDAVTEARLDVVPLARFLGDEA